MPSWGRESRYRQECVGPQHYGWIYSSRMRAHTITELKVATKQNKKMQRISQQAVRNCRSQHRFKLTARSIQTHSTPRFSPHNKQHTQQNDEWRAWLQIMVRQVSKRIMHTMHATGRLTEQVVWKWTGKQNSRTEMQQEGVMANIQALIPLVRYNSLFNYSFANAYTYTNHMTVVFHLPPSLFGFLKTIQFYLFMLEQGPAATKEAASFGRKINFGGKKLR